jgi:two-component system response regulator HupR/HoxA
MIDWKNVKDLHVNKNLEAIIGKWFGVDIFYTDKHGNIHSNITEKDYDFQNHFFKVQMSLTYGHEHLSQDIEKGLEELAQTDQSVFTLIVFFLTYAH